MLKTMYYTFSFNAVIPCYGKKIIAISLNVHKDQWIIQFLRAKFHLREIKP